MIEGVVPLNGIGHLGVAEPGVGKREDLESVDCARDQISKLVGRGGKTAEQQQAGAGRIACVAIKDINACNVDHVMRRHVNSCG
jgi:hypothetical protein